MTIKELIEELEKYPQNDDVCLVDNNCVVWSAENIDEILEHSDVLIYREKGGYV